MLDTIVLTLDKSQFDVLLPERFSPSAKGLLGSPHYPLGSRGKLFCVQNPTKADLQAGRYLPRLTLIKQKISNGFVLTLRIEFSAPRLVFGNNFDELEAGDFPKILDVLHQAVDAMGIRVTSEVLRSARVSAIHYSKNVALTDYTTCSMIMRKLALIDLNKRLDLSHTDYRDDGHAIRYHANSFEVIFYDKLKDLKKAGYSKKRCIERDYGTQSEILRQRDSFPKQLEVLRMEARLGKRAKIRSLLECIQANVELTFEGLFSARIAKLVLGHFWAHIRAQLMLIDKANARQPEAMLAALAVASKGTVRPGKLLRQLGGVMLVDSIGVRGASAILSRHCGPRSCQRYKREFKALPVASANAFSALKQVHEALARFEPLRIAAFRANAI
jgi:hypothetical protein